MLVNLIFKVAPGIRALWFVMSINSTTILVMQATEIITSQNKVRTPNNPIISVI